MCARHGSQVRALVAAWACAVAHAGVEVVGIISVDLLTPAPLTRGVGRGEETMARNKVTQAPIDECVYQYPETKQIDALLSDMMNQLAKIYVQMKKYLQDGADSSQKRFRVVAGESSNFFDRIYTNMTDEYRRFVNHTTPREDRASNPCEHQTEIREVWRTLLHSSQDAVRRAALTWMEEYLRVSRTESPAERTSARSRARQLLRREIAFVRRRQLALLCDKFQLCYHDLL